MPRPKKWRKVCCLPESNLFGPITPHANKREIVVMSVEEYEVIRLVDLESLSQEDAAEKMQVARSTAQRIYICAKQKIADALVHGKILKIEGGDYKLCTDFDSDAKEGTGLGCGGCRRQRGCNQPSIQSDNQPSDPTREQLKGDNQ